MRWTSLAAFLLVLLFAGAADGLMDVLGPAWFLLAGALVMGLAWILERRGDHDKVRSLGRHEQTI